MRSSKDEPLNPAGKKTGKVAWQVVETNQDEVEKGREQGLPCPKSDSADGAFPVAVLEDRPAGWRRWLPASRWWWVTLVALVIAGYLVGHSIQQSGPQITIDFPEGHGLQVGDFVRHRGIDVGHVDQIRLTPDLKRVEVLVTLLHGADGLAREGSQFWIVRPQLSLTQVSGLETAIGAKYIAVRPGPEDASFRNSFVGLVAPPVGDGDPRGLEVVLRGEQGFGLHPGAPVAWRGVTVGQVLAVDLASDARFVDVRARIQSPYRSLVRTQSQFWPTSGLGIDAGLSGFRLRAESLTTIARGGVSFITPAGDGDTVQPGHVFTLHGEEDPAWTRNAAAVGLLDFPLPPTMALQTQWKQTLLGFSRPYQSHSIGLLVGDSDSPQDVWLMGPAGDLFPPPAAVADSWKLTAIIPGTERSLTISDSTGEVPEPLSIGYRKLESASDLQSAVVPVADLSPMTRPVDCCLVRSVAGPGGPTSLFHSISQTDLSGDESGWQLEGVDSHLEDWHGSVVMTAKDGRIVGMFLSSASGSRIQPLPLPWKQTQIPDAR